jgi:hypothetical protein
MMEIAFGPVIAACALKSLMFGALFAILFPMLETRLAKGTPASGIVRRLGLGLLSGGLFGIAHLAIVCAADGFPPRIIQSTGLALLIIAATGFTLVRNVSSATAVRG